MQGTKYKIGLKGKLRRKREHKGRVKIWTTG